MNRDRYKKALQFIFERQHFGIKLGLDNIRSLAESLGNPHHAYPSIHIAGSNGKGSTSSFIAGILQAAGYRVGLYTSPHLADYRERIRVDGRKISGKAVADFVERFLPDMLRSQATFFEVTTALAFWYFARQKVEWAVIETGLGGRLDATNIVTPAVTVITNISLEHTNILGKTIYKIAGEKAGIIKPRVPTVTGVIDNGNDAARRFKEICRERQSPIYFHEEEALAADTRDGREILSIKKGLFAGLTVPLALAGRHQIHNAYLAVRAVELLRMQGVRISRDAVRRGLAFSYWPARFMKIRDHPTVIIDAAHNIEGFSVLAETLVRHYPGRKFDFLVGMVELKRGDRCLEIIAPLARSISAAPLENERSDDPYFLISRLLFHNHRVRVFPDALTACKDLLENCSRSDILIITGSHFLVGELAPYIKRDGF